MYVFASGQYSLPSFNWQQQVSILLPVSVQIRPDSDRCAELADPANSNATATALNQSHIHPSSLKGNIHPALS